MGKFENTPEPAQDKETIVVKLIRITGIAQKTAEVLYEIGIHRYEDLVEYANQHTAEEISAEFKTYGLNRSPGLINREIWIKEAEAFSRQESADFPERELPGSEERAADESSEHDAVFTVSFDIMKDENGELVLVTTVYDERDSGEEKIFQGNDPAPWIEWMMKRVDLPTIIKPGTPPAQATEQAPPTEIEAPPPPAPSQLPEFNLDIVDVKIFRVEPTNEVSEKRFIGNIKFKLPGPDATTLASLRPSFEVQIDAIDVDSGFPQRVASKADELQPNVLEYSYQTELAMLPEGRHEFHSIIRSLPDRVLRAYHRGPIIHVPP